MLLSVTRVLLFGFGLFIHGFSGDVSALETTKGTESRVHAGMNIADPGSQSNNWNDRFAVDREAGDQLPSSFRLEQNYPNPFNPVTMIRYALPQDTGVRLTVFNTLGQEVAVLVDQYQEAGTYRVDWDGTNDAGLVLASGLYLYRLETAEFAQTKRMVFVK